MEQLSLMPEKTANIDATCRSCGSSFTLSPGIKATERARECLVCPVCWASGQSLDDSLSSGKAECRPSQGFRLLGCIRPDGPELLVNVHAYPPLDPECVPDLLRRAGYIGGAEAGRDGMVFRVSLEGAQVEFSPG